jgi:hypothetical protein
MEKSIYNSTRHNYCPSGKARAPRTYKIRPYDILHWKLLLGSVIKGNLRSRGKVIIVYVVGDI